MANIIFVMKQGEPETRIGLAPALLNVEVMYDSSRLSWAPFSPSSSRPENGNLV
jgi:hypothetical protein